MRRAENGAYLTVGGVEVELFSDMFWRRTREKYGVPDDFLASTSTFSFEQLKGEAGKGGGKGGNRMAFDKTDRKYLVKELSGGDHEMLKKLANELEGHIDSDDGSLLARFFLHFKCPGAKALTGGTSEVFVVMNNWLVHPEGFPRAYDAVYDLKGCADDKTLVLDRQAVAAVHKRIWNVGMWVSKHTWSSERHAYYQGKVSAVSTQFHVTYAQRQRIVRALQKDIKLLKLLGLMDYSLIVGVRSVAMEDARRDPALLAAMPSTVARGVKAFDDTPRASPRGAAAMATDGDDPTRVQPILSVRGDRVFLLYVGVIDYLQSWGAGKYVANAIKVAERNKATVPPREYGDRFVKYFEEKFVADALPYEARAPPPARARAQRSERSPLRPSRVVGRVV